MLDHPFSLMKTIITIILLVIGCYVVVFSDLTDNSKTAVIVLGVISSVIANYIYDRYKKPEQTIIELTKQLEKLAKQIDQSKDPSEILKKSEKLEEEIKCNNKITQEEKESLTQSIHETKEKKSKEFFDSGLKKFNEVPPKLDAALEDFNKAIEINPDYEEAYFYRGLVYAIKNLNEDALKDLDKVTELNPDHFEAYRKRGELKDLKGNHEGAKKDYAKASNCEGIMKDGLGHYDEAIKDYDEAIRLKPDYAIAYYNRGCAKGALGHNDEAIKDYDETIRLNPDDAIAYNNRGSAKYKLGHYDEAIKDYDEAIRLYPDYAIAYNNRGTVKDELGHYDKAVNDYDEAIRLNPDYAEAYTKHAKCCMKLAEEETDPVGKAALIAMSEKDKKMLEKLNQKQVQERIKYVLELINQKKFEYAGKLLKQIIDRIPDCAEAYLYRGICKENMNNRWGALNDYKQAIRYNSKLKEAYLNRGSILMEMEEFLKEASDNFTRFIELDPNLADGYKKRSQCYRLMAKGESDPTRKRNFEAMAENDEKKANDLSRT